MGVGVLLSLGSKALGGFLTETLKSGTSDKLFGMAMGVAGFDETDAKLEAIQQALSDLNTKVNDISKNLIEFHLSAAATMANEHTDKIEDYYEKYSAALQDIATYAHQRDEVNPDTGSTYWSTGVRVLKKVGEQVSNDITLSMLRVHHGVNGDGVAQQGILSLARKADLEGKDSRGFLNHYIAMRIVFLRYWSAQQKGIALMKWISTANSGIDFRSHDSGGRLGPISTAHANLQKQEGTFEALLGPQVVRLAVDFLQAPRGEGMSSVSRVFYAEKDAPWDHRHYTYLMANDRIIFGSSLKSKANYNLKPIIMWTKPGMLQHKRDAFDFAWTIQYVDVEETDFTSAEEDYIFRIFSDYRKADADKNFYYLHFGHPSGEAGEFAVASLNSEASLWRIVVNETPDSLSFQFAKNAWGTENGWFMRCHWNKQWTFSDDGETSPNETGVLMRVHRDQKDLYQRFEISDRYEAVERLGIQKS